MTQREKTLAVIRRQATGFIPFTFGLCPSKAEEFTKKYGTGDYYEYYDMPYNWVGAAYKGNSDFTRYFDDHEKLIIASDWGTGRRLGDVEHFSHVVSPLKNASSLDDFKSYPYPDVALYNWDEVKENVDYIQKVKEKACVACMALTIFEVAWQTRGMEELFVDFLTQPELAVYHIDRITEIRVESAKRYALAGVDVLHLGDDVATQRGMLMAPEMWREYFKPRLKQVIDSAKQAKPDIIIDYHTDGDATVIVPDLIEIGVDVLNPVQPECMDVDSIFNTYGDRLSFRGCLGTQTTIPFGTTEDVKNHVQHLIDLSEKHGGISIEPSHMIEPEVPLENIETYVKMLQDYNNSGKFRTINN